MTELDRITAALLASRFGAEILPTDSIEATIAQADARTILEALQQRWRYIGLSDDSHLAIRGMLNAD